MSNHDDVLQRVLQEIIGETCEAVDNPYGSILRLDIGPLSVLPEGDEKLRPHGWRHFTILSPWRLVAGGEVVSDWNDEGGARGTLTRFVSMLKGRRVTAATAQSPTWDLNLEFEGGQILQVFSDVNDDREDSWFVLGSDKLEIGVAPLMERAGGVRVRRSA